MAGVLDFLFGAGPLKKAAGTGTPAPPAPAASAPPTLDIGKMAQDQADKVLAKKKKKPAAVDTIQKQMASSTDDAAQ